LAAGLPPSAEKPLPPLDNPAGAVRHYQKSAVWPVIPPQTVADAPDFAQSGLNMRAVAGWYPVATGP